MMRSVRLLAAAALAAATSLAACGDGPRDDAARLASASSASSAAHAEGAPAPKAGRAGAAAPVVEPAAAPCPLAGQWAQCSVQDRMDKAGLVARPTGERVRRPGFAVPGLQYAVGEGTVELFLYGSAEARARDFATLDSATASPRGGPPTAWPRAPTLVASDNLMAVLYDVRERQAERVVLALTAGLPPR